MSPEPASLAKTTRPSFTGVLPRDRLFSVLDGTRKSVIWVTGPPGCGKTTLVASYLERRKHQSLWYQVDEGDADAASFFYYLGLAASDLKRKTPLRLPQLTPEYQAAIGAFTRRYFQALYAHLGSPFSMVLDGYHEVSAQSVFHEAIRVALSEVPAQCVVVLISRSDPPPTLARLRANQALELLGWEELRLTHQESNAIVSQRGHQLSDQTLKELYEKTQGWAAGLILTLEQIAGRNAIAQVPELSTSQLVFDYLAGEIFEKSDSRTQSFLLNTAYLPQMTAEMACRLTAESDAGELLARMYRDNYFVTLKQAKPQPVYQYHPLLREFLLSRVAQALDKDTRTVLQRRTAALLEEEGLIGECVFLLREINDWDRMVSVIRSCAELMLNRGMAETLAQWVAALPKEVQQQHPWTLYWSAVARMHASPRESRILHEQAFELFRSRREEDELGLMLSCSGAMDAILYELDDFTLLDRWIPIMDELLQAHPQMLLRAAGARLETSLLASMVIRQPHHQDLEKWVERAYATSVAQDNADLRMLVEPRVAIAIIWGGHYPKAWAVIEGMRQLCARHEVSPFALSMLKLAEVMYFMLTARHDECLHAMHEGLEIERSAGVHVISHQLLVFGAGGMLICGDYGLASTLLSDFEKLPRAPARFDLCIFHLFSAWQAMLVQDNLRAFQQQKAALRTAVEVGCPYFEVLCRLSAAEVLYDAGERTNALAQFQHAYDVGRMISNHQLEFTGLMSYARIALEDSRRRRSGLQALRQALAVGKPRNFVQYLLWRPDPLARLMTRALEARIEPDYVCEIIRRCTLTLDSARHALSTWPWPVRVRTLGQFVLLRGQEPVVSSGKGHKRPLELLKALIAFGGREVSEIHLSEALWPRVDGDSAHRSFTSTLHRLRKLLGEERALVLSEGKLSIDGRFIWTDTWAFDQLTVLIDQTWHGRRESVEKDAVARLGERFLDLYRGAFLGHEPEEPWTQTLRQRLRNRYVRSAGDIARFWQQTGDTERAVGFLHRALEGDDLAESVYRQLMQCYAELGRIAEAVESYARCRSVLGARLGVEPSAETRAIYEKLLHAG